MRSFQYYSLGFLVSCLNAAAHAETTNFRPFTKTDIFLYSEPVSLGSVRKNWQGRYWQNGERQIGSLRTAIGATNGRWSVGGLYREDYYLNFSSDTADLYYNVENDLPINRNSPYALSLDAYRFRGVGVIAKKHFTFNPTLHGSLGLSLFKASNLLDGKLEGQASSTSDDEYNFVVSVDNQYSADPLFERQLDQLPSGIGLALDANLSWQATPKLQVSLEAKDIAGLIRWENVPYTRAQANSNNVTVDGNGFTQVNPTLTGQEGYSGHFTQSLKPSAEMTVQYDIGQSSLSTEAKLKYFEGISLVGLGLRKKVHSADLGLRYWPSISTLELSTAYKQFSLSIGLDEIDLDDSRSTWLSFSYGSRK